MNGIEYRAFDPQMEVRSVAKRLLAGIVVPYGLDTRIDDALVERFETGAFAHQFRAAHRVRLLNYHSNQPGHTILGHATGLRDADAGLWGEFRVTESRDGDHYLALAADGTLAEWSVGFRPDAARQDKDVTVYTKATLFETALVPEGAYGALAQVASVRARLPVLPSVRDSLLATLPPSMRQG